MWNGQCNVFQLVLIRAKLYGRVDEVIDPYRSINSSSQGKNLPEAVHNFCGTTHRSVPYGNHKNATERNIAINRPHTDEKLRKGEGRMLCVSEIHSTVRVRVEQIHNICPEPIYHRMAQGLFNYSSISCTVPSPHRQDTATRQHTQHRCAVRCQPQRAPRRNNLLRT